MIFFSTGYYHAPGGKATCARGRKRKIKKTILE
jgi:hypothetical protein